MKQQTRGRLFLFVLISLCPRWVVGESGDGAKRETVRYFDEFDDTNNADTDVLVHLNETQNSICHTINSCQFNYHNSTLKKNKCRCDKNCLIYGDCCHDRVVGQNDQINEREREHLGKCRLLQKNHDGERVNEVWANMISFCPANFTTDETGIRNKCENDTFDEDVGDWTYERDIPVYGRDLLFKNIYCAECYGLFRNEIEPWNFSLKCSKSLNDTTSQDFLNTSIYDYIPRDRSFTNRDLECVIQITQLIDLSQNEYNIHLCHEGPIDHCHEGFNDTYTKNLCHSYTNYIYHPDMKYKNLHCALCNFVKSEVLAEYKCDEQITFRIFGQDKPLSLLFDFRFDLELNVGYTKKCSDQETWNNYQKRCDFKHCGKNEILRDGNCEPEKLKDNGGDKKASLTVLPIDISKMEKNCPRIFLHKDEFEMDENSTVRVKTDEGEKLYMLGEYEMWNETTISICGENLLEGFQLRFSPVLSRISSISLIISLVCLFFHMVLYMLLPKLRNLPGRNLFCLTLSLFIAQLLFLTLGNGSEIRELCFSLAISMHYFFLAAFFWMNIMSFDIWRTFTCKMMRRRDGSSSERNITFIKYSLFAWILPALIVSLAVFLDFWDFSLIKRDGEIESEKLENEKSLSEGLSLLEQLKPNYGQNGICWISKRMSLFAFFACPVFCILAGNLILFSLTARAILVQQQEASKILKQKESPSKASGSLSHSSIKDEMRLKLYVKLALIMGLTWVLGFIAAALDSQFVWYPFVIFNGLQGAFIFLAFDCKRKIVKMLNEKTGISHSSSRPSRRETTTSFTSKSTTISTSLRTNPDPV